MKATWNIGFNSVFAFVKSILSCSEQTRYIGSVSQTYDSYRSLCIFKFCFDGKTVEVDGSRLTIECDKLDEEFFKLARLIPASEWRVWSNVYQILHEGKGKRDVIDELTAAATARFLLEEYVDTNTRRVRQA